MVEIVGRLAVLIRARRAARAMDRDCPESVVVHGHTTFLGPACGFRIERMFMPHGVHTMLSSNDWFGFHSWKELCCSAHRQALLDLDRMIEVAPRWYRWMLRLWRYLWATPRRLEMDTAQKERLRTLLERRHRA